MISEGMYEDGCVFSGFNYLVQVANPTRFDRASEGTIDPHSAFAFEKVAANEVAGRKVLVACDCY